MTHVGRYMYIIHAAYWRREERMAECETERELVGAIGAVNIGVGRRSDVVERVTCVALIVPRKGSTRKKILEGRTHFKTNSEEEVRDYTNVSLRR